MQPRTLVEAFVGCQHNGPIYVYLDARGRARSLDRDELFRRVGQLCAQLSSASIMPGDRVLLGYPPTGLDFVVGLWACVVLGAIAVPVQVPAPSRLQKELDGFGHIATDCGARVALTTAAYLAYVKLARAQAAMQRLGGSRKAGWPDVAWIATDLPHIRRRALPQPYAPTPDEIAYLQYTSGSTSSPRGVMISHANVIHNIAVIQEETRVTQDSVLVGWVPLFHDMGLVGGLLLPLVAGARTVFFSPRTFLRRPRLWFEAIDRYRGTHAVGPDFGFTYALRGRTAADLAALDLSSWRYALAGGEMARVATVKRMEEVLAPSGFSADAAYQNIYGIAESTLYVCGHRPAGLRVLSVDRTVLANEGRAVASPEDSHGDSPEGLELISSGCPPPSVAMAIVNAEGVAVEEGYVGEVWISSPSVSRGYWGGADDRGTFAATLKGDTRSWLRSGDLGFLDDGELFLCGRSKELVILGGRNYYPTDLEQVACNAHSGVRKGCVAAFSVDDGTAERLVILAEIKGPSDGEAVADAIRIELSTRIGVTVSTVVLLSKNTLPKTSSGKLRRLLCRERFSAGELDALHCSQAHTAEQKAPDDDVFAVLVAELEAAIGRRVDPRRSPAELGVDSLAALQWAIALDRRLEAPVAPELLLSDLSLIEMAKELRRTSLSTVHVELGTGAYRDELVAFLSRPEVDRGFVAPLSERPESIAARVDRRFAEGHWLVLRRGPTIRGCVALLPRSGGDLELSTLAIAPEASATGEPLRLWRAVLLRAHAMEGVQALVADTWEGNHRTIQALQRLGFAALSRHADPAKRPPGVRSVVFRRPLDPTSSLEPEPTPPT